MIEPGREARDMRKMILFAGVLTLSLAGCGQDPEPTDEEYILQVLANSPLAQSGNLDGTGGSGTAKDVALPEGWYRQLTGLGQLDLVFENDPATGICTVTVQRPLLADMYIDVVWDGEWTPGTKTINAMRIRRAVLEKVEDSSLPYGGWTLAAITPAEFANSSGSTAAQEVYITGMSLYSGDSLLWACASPDSFYDVETSLPTIEMGSMYRLEVEVTHDNPVEMPPYFVYGHGPMPDWQRHLLYDDGTMGDLVAGDGVYSYEWYAEDTIDPRVIAADVIDADVMADQTEQDYDSGAWTIPFIAQ
jgi:hypothetical protein